MNVDWSFSDTPGDRDAPPAPPPPRRPWPWQRRWSWRRLAAIGVVAGLAALGAWLFTRLGWVRLQNQLAAQVVYEDQRAQAGDVSAVLALQATGDPAWRAQLADQVRLGLAAPLPTGDLRPAGAPPRLAHLEPLGGDLFAATVTRDYLDPSGQVVSFDLAQNYRNLAPGVWERQPPDLTALAATTVLVTQWLSVTLPAADLPWLSPAVFQADALILQTRADWFGAGAIFGAPLSPSPRLPVRFGLPPPSAGPISRWADPAPRPIGLPRIFFAAPSGPADVLPTPLLAGRPHDAAAQAAYGRALAAQLLGLYAGQIANGPAAGRGSNDYFLDALVARVEARHLDAVAGPALLAPHEYIPIDQLWSMVRSGRGPADWHTDLAWRREAYDFLNWELAGQSPAADVRLLSALRQSFGPNLDDWLAAAIGPASVKPSSQWTEYTLAGFAAQPVTDWRPYQGLVLACDDGLRQMTNGVWHAMAPGPLPVGQAGLLVGDVSPDGANFWLAQYATSDTIGGSVSLTVAHTDIVQLADGAVAGGLDAAANGTLQVLGWSAANQLIIGVGDARENPNTVAGALSLLSLSPASPGPRARPLIPERVFANFSNQWAWNADHSVLLVQVADASYPHTPQWAQLTFSPTVTLRRLPDLADFVALSPSGDQVAFIQHTNTADSGLDHLQVLDIASASATSLAATNDLALPPGLTSFAGPVWSADGQTLAWAGLGPPGALAYLVTAPAAGGPLRVWPSSRPGAVVPSSFSPDGAYLLAIASPQPGPPAFWLFDRQAPGVPAPLAGWAEAALWLPGGHRLVLAGRAGVSGLDPASGAWQWLGAWANCQLRK